MNTRTQPRAALQVLAIALPAVMATALRPAHADIQTTQEMRTGGKLISTTVTSRAAGAERSEITMQLGPMTQKSVTLTLCAKKEMYAIDEALKMYTVTPLVAPATKPGAGKPGDGGKKAGVITTTLVALKELGEETIGGYKTRCYEVTIRNQTTGCPGDSDTTTTQQFCVAPGEDADGGGGGCELVADGAGGDGDDCHTTVVRKGDWARYDQALKNLTVRSRISMGQKAEPEAAEEGGTGQVETILKNVSRAKLPATLFAIPQGFRRVSAQELQQAQVQAMMRGMAASQNGGGE